MSDIWYFIKEAFAFVLYLIAGVVGIIIAFAVTLFLAAAPMTYWSPWLGFISIPATLTLVIAFIMWRFDI